MATKLDNYLRRHRKRLGLSQREAAFLLGCDGGSMVSRYETFARRPHFEAAIACEIVLGVPLRELFAGVYEEVESEIRGRARRLAIRLATDRPDRRTRRKLGHLERLSSRPSTNDRAAA